MSRPFEHSTRFEHAVEPVLSAITDEDALRRRLDAIGGKNATLLEHVTSGNTVRYTLRQGIDAQKLPSAVRRLHSGDLIVQREQHWELTDDSATGSASATVNGLPGSIEATSTLEPTGDGATLRVRGEVSVNVPLVGGKIESSIAAQLVTLLEREDAFVAAELAAGGTPPADVRGRPES